MPTPFPPDSPSQTHLAKLAFPWRVNGKMSRGQRGQLQVLAVGGKEDSGSQGNPKPMTRARICCQSHCDRGICLWFCGSSFNCVTTGNQEREIYLYLCLCHAYTQVCVCPCPCLYPCLYSPLCLCLSLCIFIYAHILCIALSISTYTKICIDNLIYIYI